MVCILFIPTLECQFSLGKEKDDFIFSYNWILCVCVWVCECEGTRIICVFLGMIEPSEIQQALKKLGLSVTIDEAEALCKKYVLIGECKLIIKIMILISHTPVLLDM